MPRQQLQLLCKRQDIVVQLFHMAAWHDESDVQLASCVTLSVSEICKQSICP